MKKNFTQDERELIARTVMTMGAFLDEQGLIKKGSADWAYAFCDELGLNGNDIAADIAADDTTDELFDLCRKAAKSAVAKKMRTLGVSDDVIDALNSGNVVEQIGAVAKAISALTSAPDTGDPDCDCPVCLFKSGDDVSEDELVADAIKNGVAASVAREVVRELMATHSGDDDSPPLSVEDIDRMYKDMDKDNVH